MEPTDQPPDKPLLATERRETGPPSGRPLAQPPAGQPFGERFEDLGFIGRGGMGKVHRCHDRVLDRPVAVKFLPAGDEQHAALAEARRAARLQHPGILTVYEIGRLPDGRQWLAMREVSGLTFGTVLADATREPGELRRLVTLLHKVCEAMAYAHVQGMVHRDLKPENIRVGAFGEVVVLDWGIAGETAQPYAPAGTDGFMSPEQAAGEPLDPRMDVFALGRLLERTLQGRESDDAQPLSQLARRATRPDPNERPEAAAALAKAIGRWLDGADAREAARALIAEAQTLRPQIEAARADARRLRIEAAAILDPLPSHAPIAEKLPGWTLDEQAEAAARAAETLELRYEGRLDEARRRSDEVPEARRLLADLYRERVRSADAANDARKADAYEARLRTIDTEGLHAEFLAGDGALTLVTDPPGAAVWAARYEAHGRRLEPGEETLLGYTPLDDVALGRGSWQLRLVKPGFADVIYPVLMTRCGRWDGIPPGEKAPLPIALPAVGTLGDDECYVPAGWFWSGGDPLATDGLPRRALWVDGFVMQRDPLTWSRLLSDLELLLKRGDRETAEAILPRAINGTGTFVRVELTDEGPRVAPVNPRCWTSAWPLTDINWLAAMRWATWRASVDGLPWRLPHEFEWEKAARGVDERPLPWGHHFDSTWANVVDTTPGAPHPCPTDAFPSDVGPYGVRGLAGNVRDWCINGYLRSGLPPRVRRLRVDADPRPAEYRSVRGGGWASKGSLCRPASRLAGKPTVTATQLGVRLVRAWSHR